MAGLKKKKKDKSSSPNLALVIFLVFFFLVSIGLGMWGYYGYAGQEELRGKEKSARTALAPEKAKAIYYEMLYRDLRNAVGDKLDGEEDKLFSPDFSEFWKDDYGTFKNEKNKEAAKKLMIDLREKLGGKAADSQYPSDFKKEVKDGLDEVKKVKGELAAALTARQNMEDISKKYMKSFDGMSLDAFARIDKGNADALKSVKEKSAEFDAVSKNNRQLTLEIKEKDGKIEEIKEEHATAVKALVRKINAYEKERVDLAGAGAAGGAPALRPSSDLFPLLLDVSTGKPLWDSPVGKVTHVEMELRQVTINIGSAHGAQPELTFNIFGANAQGRAEKQLKGSIEIIKVVDANTSTARITSLYDAEGQEILLNLQTRGRFLRESEAPIRDGDLLFNLFWGTRVAVAGYVSITGEASDNPAEQMRQMEDLMYLLKRNGMQVDAYVDLRDGQIKGNITSKTRYLIRGDDLRAAVAEKAPAPKMPDDEKDDKKEKEPAKEANPNPNPDRNALANAASLTLRNEARDRGLLLVSAENFSILIGYRRAHSANSLQKTGFRPSLPYAGSGDTGVIAVRPREEKGPDMDKKEKAPDMEK